MMFFKTLVLVAPITLLAGCSFLFGEEGLFPDNTRHYKNAPELAEIVTPQAWPVPRASPSILSRR